jgi:hypothetical protein
MNTNMKIFGVLGGIVVFILLLVFLMNMSYTNGQITRRNLTTAQQDVCRAHFDKMWKTIQQTAQLPDAAKDGFREMYTPLIEGRYNTERGGALMSWIQEQNPNFDWALYENVQIVIKSERESYFQEQRKLIDFQRNHKNYIQMVPNRWFLDENDTIPIVIITSQVTEDTYKTGQENNINVFEKGK